MKKGEKKRQQKALARRTKAKKERAARAGEPARAGMAIRQARSYPFLGCWVQSGWKEKGLAVVVVARRQPDGRVVFGDYLVDHYCLGVKNCFVNCDIPLDQFTHSFLPRLLPGGNPEPISADLAHELVYGSIEYAARWGFRPHPDFALAQLVLDPADAHPRAGTVEFGRDGKPFYISGPDDDPDQIIEQLERTAGPGNYNFMMMIGPDEDAFLPDEDGE